MAKVYLGFFDVDGTVDITLQSDTDIPLDVPPGENQTYAQDLAVLALELLTNHLKENEEGEVVDMTDFNPKTVN